MWAYFKMVSPVRGKVRVHTMLTFTCGQFSLIANTQAGWRSYRHLLDGLNLPSNIEPSLAKLCMKVTGLEANAQALYAASPD